MVAEESITLRYFDIRGRAEPIRLLFEELGLKYTDERIPSAEWFGTVKKQYMEKKITPFGQLPIVSIGDFHMPQQNSILRYFAAKHNVYGSSLEEKYKSDVLTDGAEDYRREYYRVVYNDDYEKLIGDFVSKTLPRYLNNFECLLSENVNQSNIQESEPLHFIGKSFNVSEVCIFDMLDTALRVAPNCLDSYKLLKKFFHDFSERPNIKSYLASGRKPEKVNNVPRG